MATTKPQTTQAPSSPATGESTIGSGRPPRSKSGNDLVSSVTSFASAVVSGLTPNGSSKGSNSDAAQQQQKASPPASSGGAAAAAPGGKDASNVPAKSLPTTRRHSGEQSQQQSSDSPAAPGASSVTAAGIASARREDSLSADLERLRLNAQAAVNGAQNGGAGNGMGPIG